MVIISISECCFVRSTLWSDKSVKWSAIVILGFRDGKRNRLEILVLLYCFSENLLVLIGAPDYYKKFADYEIIGIPDYSNKKQAPSHE